MIWEGRINAAGAKGGQIRRIVGILKSRKDKTTRSFCRKNPANPKNQTVTGPSMYW